MQDSEIFFNLWPFNKISEFILSLDQIKDYTKYVIKNFDRYKSKYKDKDESELNFDNN